MTCGRQQSNRWPKPKSRRGCFHPLPVFCGGPDYWAGALLEAGAGALEAGAALLDGAAAALLEGAATEGDGAGVTGSARPGSVAAADDDAVAGALDDVSPVCIWLSASSTVDGCEAPGVVAWARILSVPRSSSRRMVSPMAVAKNSAARIAVVRVNRLAEPRTVIRPPALPPMPSPPPSERCSRMTAISARTINR